MKRFRSYTLNVLSVEPVAIKVPKGFQDIDRKLQTSSSAIGTAMKIPTNKDACMGALVDIGTNIQPYFGDCTAERSQEPIPRSHGPTCSVVSSSP